MYKISNIACNEKRNNLGEGKTDFLELECAAKYVNKGNSNSQFIENIKNEDILWNVISDNAEVKNVNSLNVYNVEYISNGNFMEEINVPVVKANIILPKYLKNEFYNISVSVPAYETSKDSFTGERLVSSLEFITKYPCVKDVTMSKASDAIENIDKIQEVGLDFSSKINLGYLNESGECIDSLTLNNKEINLENEILNRSNINKVYEVKNNPYNEEYIYLDNKNPNVLKSSIIKNQTPIIKTRVRENGISNIFHEYTSNNLDRNPFTVLLNKKYNIEYNISHPALGKNILSYSSNKDYSIQENVIDHNITITPVSENSYTLKFNSDLNLKVGIDDTAFYEVKESRSNFTITGPEFINVNYSNPVSTLAYVNKEYNVAANTISPITGKLYSENKTYKNNPLKIYSVIIRNNAGESSLYTVSNIDEPIKHTQIIPRNKKYNLSLEVKEIREYSDQNFYPKSSQDLVRLNLECNGTISKEKSLQQNNYFIFSETNSTSENIASCYDGSLNLRETDSSINNISMGESKSSNGFYRHALVYNSKNENLQGSGDKYILNYIVDSEKSDPITLDIVFDFIYSD